MPTTRKNLQKSFRKMHKSPALCRNRLFKTKDALILCPLEIKKRADALIQGVGLCVPRSNCSSSSFEFEEQDPF